MAEPGAARGDAPDRDASDRGASDRDVRDLDGRGSNIPESDGVAADEADAAASDPEVEIVDGFPVLAEVRTVERVGSASLPVVHVAAVAATGFVAGAATVALVKRRAARKVVRNSRTGARRPADLLPIAATRSFLVDVHVIAKPE